MIRIVISVQESQHGLMGDLHTEDVETASTPLELRGAMVIMDRIGPMLSAIVSEAGGTYRGCEVAPEAG